MCMRQKIKLWTWSFHTEELHCVLGLELASDIIDTSSRILNRPTSGVISIPAFFSSSMTRFAPSLNFGFAASLIICIVEGCFPGVTLISKVKSMSLLVCKVTDGKVSFTHWSLSTLKQSRSALSVPLACQLFFVLAEMTAAAP